MKQKLFYTAFSVIYDELKTALNLTQKEAVFNLIFSDLYQYAGVEIFDYDQFRKITSGINPIHSKVRKKLHTCEGFELFRSEIENNCLPYLKNILSELLEIFNQSENIPQEIKSQIYIEIADDYHISRTIAAILDCLDYSDYLVSKGKNCLFDVGYMRLSADNAPAKYPKYITESPENGINLIGRENDIDMLNDVLIKKEENLLVTAVGGLGKTELVKRFLSEIREKDVNECGVEVIAWVQCNNNDLRMSIKQAFHMKCEIDEVWTEMQNISDKYEKRMLLVVDNIEVSDDEYLRKLSQLSCRILVTSRYRGLSGFNEKLELQPLSIDNCRELFYRHYKFEERNNEILNDIIELTAKLTIMIVFIAKAAYAEGFSLLELYTKLVEKGFKLSEEDVSCEHEKMHNDETIIKQMCILFSLVKYSNEDKKILTYISVIPNLKFDFTKAKKWFDIRKNSRLLALFNVGMLEHVTEKRTHIYWMHSVIAAAIREQQKKILYEQCAPFIHELSEDLECGEYWGTAYTKLDLIPFSWSVADLLENNLNNEDDATFLVRLFYVCFEASNYPLCEKLILKALEIDRKLDDAEMLIRDYKNYSELYLRLDDVPNALETIKKAEHYMSEIDPDKNQMREWAFLWHIYGNIYYHEGKADDALDYYMKALEADLQIENLPPTEISTDYSSIASVYQMFGDYKVAYEMIKKAMDIDDRNEENSETIMNYYYLAEICTDLVADGYSEYYDEADECYRKVIEFRENNLPKYCSDTADAYLGYSNFLYQTDNNEKSLKYSEKACKIYRRLYGEDSYHVMQCQSNKALVAAEYDIEQAIVLYSEIIEKHKFMSHIPVGDLYRDYQNYADLLEQADQYEESADYYRKTIEIILEIQSDDSPNLARPYMGLTNCNMGLQDYENALIYLDRIIKIADEDCLLKQVTYHKMAVCNMYLKKYKIAEELLLTALNCCTDTANTNIGYIYAELCRVYALMENITESEKYRQYAFEFAEQSNDEQLSDYVNTLFINSDEK